MFNQKYWIHMKNVYGLDGCVNLKKPVTNIKTTVILVAQGIENDNISKRLPKIFNRDLKKLIFQRLPKIFQELFYQFSNMPNRMKASKY